MTSPNPTEEIAVALADAQAALNRAQDIDTEHNVLSRADRESMSIPQGRIRAVQNNLPDVENQEA